MRYPIHIALLSLVLGLGCTKLQLSGDGKTRQSEDKSPATADSDVKDENVDPPANIAGAFLHCAVEQEASEERAEALLGCRFDDANGNRVTVDSIAEESVFTYRPAPVPTLKVYPKILTGDNRYDAVYLFFAESKAAVDQGMRDTRVFVQMKDAQGQESAVSGLVKNVQVDVNAIPEPRQTDYAQVRDEVLTEAATAEPPPPIPEGP